MKLIDFINTHEDWQERLSGAPYCIKIKWKGDYFICNYSQFASDFNLQEVQEARGPIFYWHGGKAEYVCRPFNKFFNYGEPNAANIDWSTAHATEKIDGSLIKVWYHQRKWHLSTNGTIDAFDSPVGDYGTTFGELFIKALGYPFEELCEKLWSFQTYCFELTSPESQVVIPYDYQIWFLAAFDNKFGIETQYSDNFTFKNVKRPQTYNLANLNDTLNLVKQMDKTHEGVVVSDEGGHRIKVKSPTYLEMAHIVNAGNKVSKGMLIDYILNGQLDDFLGVMPQYEPIAAHVKEEIIAISKEMEQIWRNIMSHDIDSRKAFALAIPTYLKPIVKQFLFSKYTHPELSALSWIFTLPSEKVMKLIGDE